MLQADAVKRLNADGFNVGRIERKESSKPPGTVLDQEPEGGKKATGGTAVNLEVAAAKGSTIEVPDVVGDTRERAMKKLNDRRLTVAHPISYQASCEEAGKVLRQQPDEDAARTGGHRRRVGRRKSRPGAGQGSPARRCAIGGCGARF